MMDAIFDAVTACLAAWCIVDIARRTAPMIGKVFLVFGIIVISTVSIAASHSWYSGACCSDQDCAPIPREAVTATNEGYRITLGAGDHPMTTLPLDEVVPYDNALPSEDSDFHACVRASVPPSLTPINRVICLYVPQGAEGV